MLDNAQNKIIFIEDDREYRRTLMNSLGFEYVIIEAESGDMAMEKILFHNPQMVILDLMLPKVDGLHVLERIRSYPDKKVSGLPVVVLTNMADHEHIDKAQQLGISAYFVKAHTHVEDIHNTVHNLLSGKE